MAWIALAPLLISLHGVSAARAFRLGYVTGAVSSLGLLYWTSIVVIAVRRAELARRDRRDGASLPGRRALSVAFRLDGRPLDRGTSDPRPCCSRPSPGWHGAPASPHLLQLPVVPARLQPAAQPAADPDRLATRRSTASRSSSRPRAACSPTWPWSGAPDAATAAALALVGVLGAVCLDGSLAGSRSPVPEAGRVRVGLVQANIRQEEKWDEAKAVGQRRTPRSR